MIFGTARETESPHLVSPIPGAFPLRLFVVHGTDVVGFGRSISQANLFKSELVGLFSARAYATNCGPNQEFFGRCPRLTHDARFTDAPYEPHPVEAYILRGVAWMNT